jgi:hypothetical protein
VGPWPQRRFVALVREERRGGAQDALEVSFDIAHVADRAWSGKDVLALGAAGLGGSVSRRHVVHLPSGEPIAQVGRATA